MLVRYTPGRCGVGESLRRAVRAVLYLPVRLRLWRDPRHPWLVRGAVRFIERRLTPGMAGFEWGSGRSTAFFGLRLCSLTSVEHVPKWFRRTSALLGANGLTNVALRLIAPENPPCPARPDRPEIWRRTGHADRKPEFTAYCDAILDFPEASLDFVCVDGRARVECALNAFSRIKPGGLLVLDNSEWEKYAPIFAAAPDWRRLDFENGVWRTSVLVKPTEGAAR